MQDQSLSVKYTVQVAFYIIYNYQMASKEWEGAGHSESTDSGCQNKFVYAQIHNYYFRCLIKGQSPGKLTSREDHFAWLV